MIYRLPSKKRVAVSTDDGLFVYGDGAEVAAGYLMELTLRSHSSVTVMGKRPDFYGYVYKVDIGFTATLTGKELFEEMPYPFFYGLTRAATTAMKKVMEEAGQGRDLVYMKGIRKERKPHLAPPAMGLCFYQLSDRGSKKERILLEATFAGLLEDVAKERMRDCVFFYEAPYKPATNRAMGAIKRADDVGCALIGIYHTDKIPEAAGRYGLTYKKNTLILTDRTKNRTVEIRL